MATDDILVINAAQLRERTTTTKSGAAGRSSTRITMSVTSEPIAYNVDPAFLLKAASEALARQIREQTQAIAEPVKPSTLKARAVAERAFHRGEPWAMKRFAGGRIGVTPPEAGATRAFNHSGRLAESIVARYAPKTKEFVINYAANRWDPANFRSTAHMQRAIQRWIDRVPALKEPRADLEVQRAFQETHGQMSQKQRAGLDEREAKNAMSRLKLFTEIVKATEGALG